MIFHARYVLAGFLWLAAALPLNAADAQASPTLQDAPLLLVPSSGSADPQADSRDPSRDPSENAWPRAEFERASEDAAAKDEQSSDDAELAYLDIDWSLLDVDIVTLLAMRPALKGPAASGQGSASDTIWTSIDKPNGSAVSVKQAVSPFWDARIGADMTVVRPPSTIAELLAVKAANGGSEPQSSGTAWAAATAPGLGSIWDSTAVEARIDPAQDQGRLRTTLSKQLTLGEQFSLTLQNGYAMTQGLAPLPGSAGHAAYATDQSARLGVLETGTSFSAGQSLASGGDEKWLRKIGVEQKIVGGFNISGSVAETTLGVPNKSISAGFKQSW